ncbi:hypothetical protein MBH78_15635 [Oceanimonas sp. NS1]|nr:hypothetical protein [Oceanimonas sp. NS1]
MAAGIFGSEALGGLGGVSLMSQLLGSLLGSPLPCWEALSSTA